MNKNLETLNTIQKEHLNSSLIKSLSIKFKQLEKKISDEVYSKHNTLNVLNKKYKFNFKKEELKKFKKFKEVAIIGMGGSILGTKSIYHCLRSKIKKKFYFFDNINLRRKSKFIKKEKLSKVLFIIVSKSGSTIETLSNFLSLKILKKNAKNIIIISENKENPLYQISKKYNLYFFEHNKNIGGRYSVLSEVGIIPAYLMGLNIKELRSSTLDFLKGKDKLFLRDSVVKLSNLFKESKIKNLIFLNYAPELEKFLFWAQQLIAESLGKKGKGFMPMISTVPKDHHSLLQLYLDGPKDKLFHIFSVENKVREKIIIDKSFKKINFLNKKNLNNIKNAQRNALIKSLKIKKIPYREFKLKNINEKVLGKLFSYFILETISIGKLVNINPFDQPAVEQVKKFTEKILN